MLRHGATRRFPGACSILNQFLPNPDQLDLLEADMLCAPSTKQIQPPPGADHFQGYPAAPAAGNDGPIVRIDDQFGSQTTDLGPPIRFLVPVDKNDEGLGDPISHLTCYRMTDGVSGPAVISTNQFGAQPLTLGAPDSLCVPTEKLITPGPVDLDHYKCYAASGAPLDVGVVLLDQFQARTALVLEPTLFCTPADKNGEGIQDPDTHLVCYIVAPEGGFLGLEISIWNQFFNFAPGEIEVAQPFAVCAPSAKEVPEPSVLVGLTSGVALLMAVDRRRRRKRERID